MGEGISKSTAALPAEVAVEPAKSTGNEVHAESSGTGKAEVHHETQELDKPENIHHDAPPPLSVSEHNSEPQSSHPEEVPAPSDHACCHVESQTHDVKENNAIPDHAIPEPSKSSMPEEIHQKIPEPLNVTPPPHVAVVSVGTQTSPIEPSHPPPPTRQTTQAPSVGHHPAQHIARKLAHLTDEQVYKACTAAGIVKHPGDEPPRGTHLAARVHHDSLREQFDDFDAFTKYMNDPFKRPPGLDRGLPKAGLFQLRVSQEKVHIKQDSKSWDEDRQGSFRWVYFRDAAGVIRSSIAKDGTGIVKTVRTIRWPSRWDRWSAFSFNGRDAHKPWERHRFVNQLQLRIESANSSTDVLEKPGSHHPQRHVAEPQSVIYTGAHENSKCTLLRVETVHALKVYCQGDYPTFLSLLHTHKTLITQDIKANLNRGPIYNAAMVTQALSAVVKASLEEYIPQTTMAYVRDIMFHFLANRDLVLEDRFNGAKWSPRAFDTSDFNAASHISTEFHGGFFREVIEIIRQGYGPTIETRIKSGAAVCAVLYTASLMAMDVADEDNALYAQDLVRAVGIVFNAANSLVLASPIAQASMITSNLLIPMASQIKDKINNRYRRGALRESVVKWFRDTYVVGAIRGERIPGIRFRREDEVADLPDVEKGQFLNMMKRRRALGRKFEKMTHMYVNALGEQWPCIEFVDEETYASLSDQNTHIDS